MNIQEEQIKMHNELVQSQLKKQAYEEGKQDAFLKAEVYLCWFLFFLVCAYYDKIGVFTVALITVWVINKLDKWAQKQGLYQELKRRWHSIL